MKETAEAMTAPAMMAAHETAEAGDSFARASAGLET